MISSRLKTLTRSFLPDAKSSKATSMRRSGPAPRPSTDWRTALRTRAASSGKTSESAYSAQRCTSMSRAPASPTDYDAVYFLTRAVRRRLGKPPRAHVGHAGYTADRGDNRSGDAHLAHLHTAAVHRPSTTPTRRAAQSAAFVVPPLRGSRDR